MTRPHDSDLPSAVDLLAREAALLVTRLRVWTPSRWAAFDRVSRAVTLLEACERAAATWEGRAPRQVPDLGAMVVADQLAVLADDAVRAARDAAVPDLEVAPLLAALLRTRTALLDDEVPSGLRGRLAAWHVTV